MNLKPINYLKIVMPTSPGFFFKSDRLLNSEKEVVCKDKIFFFATRLLTLYRIIHGLTATLEERTFENIVGKRENAGHQHFLLFATMLCTLPKTSFRF